jgi:CheY-like chemotaxis protein
MNDNSWFPQKESVPYNHYYLQVSEEPRPLFSHLKRCLIWIGGNMKKRFILVADTNDAFVDLLREELATTTYALLHAKDGQEAIDYLELLKAEIDLAVIEMELPVVSGLYLIWRLVRRKKSKPLKIIATTSVDVPKLNQVVKELGVAAIVQFPVAVQDWRKTIETVLGR